MNVSGRLALTIGALVACTAIMGAAGLLAIQDTHERFRATDELYEEVRGLYEIGHRAATARLLLNTTPPEGGDAATSAAEIRHQLIAGLRETDRLLERASAPAAGRRALLEPLQSIRASFEAAIVADRDPLTASRDAQRLNATLGQIASSATGANREILANRQATTQRVEQARWTLGIVLAATLLVALLLGSLQHQSIARPLRALRHGVERLAAGRLREPIAESGPSEFRALISQFNRMAATIHALESSLCRQVEVKDRQLIRSERLAGVGFLAAGLAHEINTPLGVIAGHAQTMLRRLHAQSGAVDRGAASPDTERELIAALETISDEAFRCRDITLGMLHMTRHDDAAPQAIDLRALIERTIGLLRPLPACAERRIDFAEAPGPPLLARGSRTQLTQVLLNLMTNALHAIEPERGVVSVSLVSQAGSALIRITDNGRGMTTEALARVFDPLYTDAPQREHGGFGLGLSVSHAIIERHGGRLDAASDGPGRGSTFLIELPAVTAATAATTAPARRS